MIAHSPISIETQFFLYSLHSMKVLAYLYLEAFSCGCAVAASNCSSLPEVGGEAVNYFDPKDSDSIQNVVAEIVHNNSLQDSLRIRGYQRLKLFSWEKTALNTKNVYDNLLSQ